MDDRHEQKGPFWIPATSRKALRIDLDRSEVIRHEVLYEDEVTQVRDRAVFVGSVIPEWRLVVGYACVCLALVVLLLRAGWLQVANGSTYRVLADSNRFRTEIVPARRGVIRDVNGTIIAENVPSFDLRVRWSDLPADEGERQEAVFWISQIVGVTEGDVLEILHPAGMDSEEAEERANEWMTVAKDIPYEKAIAAHVRLPEFSGVMLVTSAKRRYPFSANIPSLSHILGYVGPLAMGDYERYRELGYRRNDEIGRAGIERAYENRIRGTAGERRVEVDAFGRPCATLEEQPSIDGQDVTLSIDLGLQGAAERALKGGLERAKVSRGSVVVMDVETGAIRAVVSWPAYDNNAFAGHVSSTVYASLLADEDHPLFPRAWSGQFPSGSVIKPLISVAALQEGVITPQTTVISTGGISVGPWFFPDWLAGGHGATNVRRAISMSVNTFFYYIGGGYGDFRGLGVDRLTDWMQRFFLGSPTGLDIAGEASGNVPSDEWKLETKGERWYIGDTYNLSIGQGDLLVTPLQIARVTASVANGGRAVIPHLVENAPSGDVPIIQADASVWEVVRQGMRDTVMVGSGRALAGLRSAPAGKTGTAQWRSDKPNHAWFTGYAPFDAPKIVVTVLIEEGEEGSRYAVPVAGEILQAWSELQE